MTLSRFAQFAGRIDEKIYLLFEYIFPDLQLH